MFQSVTRVVMMRRVTRVEMSCCKAEKFIRSCNEWTTICKATYAHTRLSKLNERQGPSWFLRPTQRAIFLGFLEHQGAHRLARLAEIVEGGDQVLRFYARAVVLRPRSGSIRQRLHRSYPADLRYRYGLQQHLLHQAAQGRLTRLFRTVTRLCRKIAV